MSNRSPKLRTVNKAELAFPINQFPNHFPILLGRELIYLLATKSKPTVEGPEWEQIFANCVGADWKPSNVGLDDVILDSTAWGAKTVKNPKPSKAKTVRLISGRNSPNYSFGESIDTTADPNLIGEMVLDIWNERVSDVRKRYKQLRTVVLIKSEDLTEVVVFEFETIRYDPELYQWRWNKNNNLEGVEKNSKKHIFTWQPHGSQFTIKEEVPNETLVVRLRKPESLDKDTLLDSLGVDDSWIEYQHKK